MRSRLKSRAAFSSMECLLLAACLSISMCSGAVVLSMIRYVAEFSSNRHPGNSMLYSGERMTLTSLDAYVNCVTSPRCAQATR